MMNKWRKGDELQFYVYVFVIVLVSIIASMPCIHAAYAFIPVFIVLLLLLFTIIRLNEYTLHHSFVFLTYVVKHRFPKY